MRIVLIVLGLSTLLLLDSCRKDLVYDDDAVVRFESDTLHFDTAFTSTTTPTQRILLHNPSSKSVHIRRIALEQGANSYFRLAVDGETGYQATDIDILPEDSAYIFVSATLDPNSDSLPFLVMDKIIAETDGGTSSCVIDAYGQNAIFYRDTTISTTTWKRDLPIVLLGNVTVDRDATLTIRPGARIYVQSKKFLAVEGTLKAIGSPSDSITFQGNRLDRAYFLDADHPAEWGGIYLGVNSHSNELENVYIKNATVGIYLDSLPRIGQYKLKLRKSTVYNCLAQGILSVASSCSLTNSRLISSNVNLGVVKGGDIYVNHCTLGGYATKFNPHGVSNKSVSMILLNYQIIDNTIYPGVLQARIYNSVVHGVLDQEAIIDSLDYAGFYLELRNNLLQTTSTSAELQSISAVYENNILNEDPDYTDPSERDYSYNISSPIYRKTSTYNLPDDIKFRPRSLPTDLGCEQIQ